MENTVALLQKIRSSLPYAPVFYVGVSPCWSREGAWEAIEISNDRMRQYCASQPNIYYIDIASACRGADGKPDPDLFLSDKLHPSAAGYAVWTQVVAGTVKRVLRV